MKLILRKEEEQLHRDVDWQVWQDEEWRVWQDEEWQLRKEEEQLRLSSSEGEHLYPQMREEGYVALDPREGFKEPYEDFWRHSPASSTGHSGASTSRFLTNVRKSVHRLKSATAVVILGQGSKVVQTNLAKLKLQTKELDQAANGA